MEVINQLSAPPSAYEQTVNTLAALGLGSPIARVIAGFILGSGLTWLFQPAWAFDSNGPRPVKLDKDDPRGTYMPWYGPGIILALLFGVFL